MRAIDIPLGFFSIERKCHCCPSPTMMTSGEWLLGATDICPKCGAMTDDAGNQYDAGGEPMGKPHNHTFTP